MRKYNPLAKTNYDLTGNLYLPNQASPISINGACSTNSSSELEGKMSFPNELRDTIQGMLINTKQFCVPHYDDEDNQRNILMLAHFSRDNGLPNKMFYLVKNGKGFEGKYTGKMECGEECTQRTPIGLEEPKYLVDSIRYIDFSLNDNKSYNAEITLKKKSR